ncbi:MAG: hypothetical protein J6A40_08895 [Bacteroides sp.]|nr:hypothetical protein [Bacteroides sp.]
MKRIILFIIFIASGALARASEAIIVLTRKDVNQYVVNYYTITNDSMFLMSKSPIINDTDAFLWNNTPVSETWDNKEKTYIVSFYTDCGIRKLELSEYDWGYSKAFSNKKTILPLILTNTEVEYDSDLMEIVLFNGINNRTNKLSIRNNQVMHIDKKENVYLAYFDEFPRGAGVKSKTIMLKVVDCKKRNVLLIDQIRSQHSDLSYEHGEEVFVNTNIQWLNTNEIVYMTIQKKDEGISILNLYKYSLKAKERILYTSIYFPHSIENISFRILDDKLYISNLNRIYLFKNKMLHQIVCSDDIVDFYIDKR